VLRGIGQWYMETKHKSALIFEKSVIKKIIGELTKLCYIKVNPPIVLPFVLCTQEGDLTYFLEAAKVRCTICLAVKADDLNDAKGNHALGQ
jgi:hypothetical protein